MTLKYLRSRCGGVRRAIVLVVLLLTAGPALAERQCSPPQEDGGRVCSDGFVGTEVSEPTPLGEARVETYTDQRDGGGDVDYTVVRDGVRVSLGTDRADVQRLRYEGEAEDTERPGETRVVRFEEVRVDAADRRAGVGLRRASYSDDGAAVEVCDVYALDESVEAPCSPLFP